MKSTSVTDRRTAVLWRIFCSCDVGGWRRRKIDSEGRLRPTFVKDIGRCINYILGDRSYRVAQKSKPLSRIIIKSY